VEVLGTVLGRAEMGRSEWKKPEEQLAVLAVVSQGLPVREQVGLGETRVFLGCWMWGGR
jgi:hypothetical protein